MSSFYSDMIYEKILEAGNEAVFIATDFLDIADYETARKALNRLDSYGKIKIGRASCREMGPLLLQGIQH